MNARKLTNDKTQAIMTRLSINIRVLREAEKLSIREFADKVGVGHSDVFRLENGSTKNPSVFLVQKIAQAFNLTVDELMSFDADPCPTCGGSGWIKTKK